MRASKAGVSVVASWPACLLKSPASRSSRNCLLQRLINASLQSSFSRIAAQVWSASSSNISRARRASSARPLRLAARWLSSRRSESVSTMVFSMNTSILPFQLLQSTSSQMSQNLPGTSEQYLRTRSAKKLWAWRHSSATSNASHGRLRPARKPRRPSRRPRRRRRPKAHSYLAPNRNMRN